VTNKSDIDHLSDQSRDPVSRTTVLSNRGGADINEDRTGSEFRFLKKILISDFRHLGLFRPTLWFSILTVRYKSDLILCIIQLRVMNSVSIFWVTQLKSNM